MLLFIERDVFMKKWLVATISLCVCLSSVLVLYFILFNNEIVLSTDNYKIDDEILDYYIEIEKNDYVDNYAGKYGEYFLETAGLNPQKSLKNQESCYGGTWYDYFRDIAMENLETKLLYCEAARENNIKPDDELLKKSEENLKRIFGKINNSYLKKISKIEALNDTYLSELKKNISISDEEKTKFYENNRKIFDCVDFDCIIINQQITDDTINEKELVKNIVDSIKNTGFEETVKLYNLNNNEFCEIKSEIQYKYDGTSELGSWAFAVGRQVGDVISFEGRGIYTVYHIKKTAYPYDYRMKKIQKISLNTNDKESYNKLYKIAEKLSENQNTNENVLLYASESGLKIDQLNVSKEDLSLNLKNWLYENERKIGEYTILEDGLHRSFVRYFGEGDSYFETQLTKSVLELKIENNLNKLKKEITIKQ